MSTPSNTPSTAENQRKLYDGMMKFGYTVGIPVGGAISVFFTLALMKVSLPVCIIIAFFTWLGVLGVSKTFFVH